MDFLNANINSQHHFRLLNIINHVVDYRVQYSNQNAAAPTGGGNNQPAAAAAIEDSEEQQEMMEEAARRAVFNRKMMSVIPQLGEIAPIVDRCEVLEVTSTGRQPKRKRNQNGDLLQNYRLKADYSGLLSSPSTDGLTRLKIVIRMVQEVIYVGATTDDRPSATTAKYEDFKKGAPRLRGSRQVLHNYLSDFAKHFLDCYKHDVYQFATDYPNICIKKNGSENLKNTKSCKRCMVEC
eukprot:scaffold10687_cov116-Cylindrotheca_fusiformis.AAC.2